MAFCLLNSLRVRKYDVKIGDQIRWAQTEEQIVRLFSQGSVTRDSPCRLTGSPDWQDVNEFFPTLKYGCAVTPPELPAGVDRRPTIDLDRDERHKPAMTSSLKAGWICFGLGLLVAWIFPPAFIFYSIALIMAVVAMCTHQVNKGLALLLSSFIGMGTSAMISFFLAVGLFAAAAAPVVAKVNKDIERQREAQRQLMEPQRKALASLNKVFTQPAPLVPRQPTPTPIRQMSKRQLFEEIERVEKQQRNLRSAGQDLPLSTVDYLEKLRTALDSGT